MYHSARTPALTHAATCTQPTRPWAGVLESEYKIWITWQERESWRKKETKNATHKSKWEETAFSRSSSNIKNVVCYKLILALDAEAADADAVASASAPPRQP